MFPCLAHRPLSVRRCLIAVGVRFVPLISEQCGLHHKEYSATKCGDDRERNRRLDFTGPPEVLAERLVRPCGTSQKNVHPIQHTRPCDCREHRSYLPGVDLHTTREDLSIPATLLPTIREEFAKVAHIISVACHPVHPNAPLC